MDIKKLLNENFSPHSLSISHEGFGDAINKIAKLFSAKKPEQLLGDDEKEHYKEMNKGANKLVEDIKSTYLNDSWLKKQSLVEGEISAGDFSMFLVLDGKLTDPIGNLKETKRRWDKLQNWLKSNVGSYDREIQRIDNELHQAYDKLKNPTEEDAENLFKQAVDKINKLKDPLDGYPFSTLTFLRGRRVEKGKQIDDLVGLITVNKDPKQFDLSVEKLPALNRTDIKEVANILCLLLQREYFESFYPNGTDHSDGKINENDMNRTSSSFDEYYDLTYYQRMWDLYVPYPIREDEIIRALERWINRSIK